MSNELRRVLFPWYDQTTIVRQETRTETNRERLTQVNSIVDEVQRRAESAVTMFQPKDMALV